MTSQLKKEVASLYLTVSSTEEMFPIDMEGLAPDGRPVWEWMDYSRKDAATRSLSKLIEGVDYLVHNEVEQVTSANGVTQTRAVLRIKFSVDGFKRWGMGTGTSRGRQIQDHFLECERRAAQPNMPRPKPLELTLDGAQIIDARAKSNKDLSEMAKENDLTYWQTHQKRNEEFLAEETKSLRKRAGTSSWHRKADLKTQMLVWYVNQKILEEAKEKKEDGLLMDIDDVGTVSRTVRKCLEPIEGKDFRANFMPMSISEERAARMLKSAKEVDQPSLF